jgi:integrase
MPENLRPLIIFLLATGCRMSEALELDWREVARAVIPAHQCAEQSMARREKSVHPVHPAFPTNGVRSTR